MGFRIQVPVSQGKFSARRAGLEEVSGVPDPLVHHGEHMVPARKVGLRRARSSVLYKKGSGGAQGDVQTSVFADYGRSGTFWTLLFNSVRHVSAIHDSQQLCGPSGVFR